MATDFSKFLFCECTGMTSFVLKFGVKKPKMGEFFTYRYLLVANFGRAEMGYAYLGGYAYSRP